MGGERLDDSVQLLRVVKDRPEGPNKTIHTVAGRRRPDIVTIRPTPADLLCNPVRVSVWDHRQIGRARAIEIRAGQAAGVAFAAFMVKVERVREVAVLVTMRRLDAVTDPDGAIGCEPHECCWHYGIEGMELDAYANKAIWEAMLYEMTRAFIEV